MFFREHVQDCPRKKDRLIVYRKQFFHEMKIMKNKFVILLSAFTFLGYILESFGQVITTAGKASLLVTTSIIYVAIFSMFWLNEKMTKLKVSGIVMGIAGIIFLTVFQDPTSFLGGTLLGDVLCALAGLVWSLYIVFSKYFLDKEEIQAKNIISINIGINYYTSLFFVIPSIFFFNNLLTIRYDLGFFIIIIYLGLFCTLIAYILYFKGLEEIEATTSNIILLSQVIVAILIGIIFLQESINFFIIIGSALVIGAIILINIHGE
ncbi:MAG: DMT family transporter [Candidatus Helarchaeota archaeon]